ncbi:VanZ family protein [Neobacillus sp. D3-1R]|uniref:VanZ family protein n=1 Tax=Neobacillus sp. D3-1R TaxID=3445778 RepID=UPI003F9F1AAA
MKKSYLLATVLSVLLFSLFSHYLFQLTYYLHPIALVTVLVCLWGLLAFFILLIRRERIFVLYHRFIWFISIYTIMLLILLFFRPGDHAFNNYNLVPFSTVHFFLSGRVNPFISFYNLVANVVLFIPYGIYLLARKNHTSLLAYVYLPFITISLIEMMQLLTHRGSLDIDDLILNMLGVFLGYLCYPVFKRVIKLV